MPTPAQKMDYPSPEQLMAKPAMSFAEFWQGLLDLPESTAEEITREGGGPRFFLIGRRRYVRREDALDWIEQQAEARPYFPRKNNRRGAVA